MSITNSTTNIFNSTSTNSSSESLSSTNSYSEIDSRTSETALNVLKKTEVAPEEIKPNIGLDQRNIKQRKTLTRARNVNVSKGLSPDIKNQRKEGSFEKKEKDLFKETKDVKIEVSETTTKEDSAPPPHDPLKKTGKAILENATNLNNEFSKFKEEKQKALLIKGTDLNNEFPKLKEEQEKAEFRESKRKEIEKLSNQIKEYERALEDRASEFKDSDNNNLTVKFINNRFKIMQKMTNKPDEFELYEQFNELYQFQKEATVILESIAPKVTAIQDFNFYNEDECKKFLPCFTTFQTQTLDLKTRSMTEEAKFKENLKLSLNPKLKQDQEESNTENMKADEKKGEPPNLPKDISDSVEKYNIIRKHIRSQTGQPISNKEWANLKSEKLLKRSQTEILDSLDNAAKNLAAAKGNLRKIDDREYQKLTGRAINVESKYQEKFHETFQEGDDARMLKNKDLLKLKRKLTSLQNEVLFYEADLSLKQIKEITGKEPINNPIKEIKKSPLYVETKDDTIKANLKGEILNVLKEQKKSIEETSKTLENSLETSIQTIKTLSKHLETLHQSQQTMNTEQQNITDKQSSNLSKNQEEIESTKNKLNNLSALIEKTKKNIAEIQKAKQEVEERIDNLTQ